MATLDEDVAAVQAEATQIAGVKTFIQGLQAQIAALPGISAADQAKIDAIFAGQTANAAALAQAIATTPAGTPAPVGP